MDEASKSEVESLSNTMHLFGSLLLVLFSAEADEIEVSVEREVSAANWWSPKATDHLSWQWQLQGRIRTRFHVDMYDVDLFDTSQSVIDELHGDGRVVVCYFSAGTYESWRGDWAEFFDFIQSGVSYEGGELPFAGKMDEWDERWLDIREIDLLAPIMKSRLALAASKKCDAVEPDNMDAFTNEGETGIPISYEEQLAYNQFISTEAHAVGLSVGLKNDLDQLEDLVDHYDWALNEQCFEFKEYDECDRYKVFTDQNKAVFGVEYKGWICKFCAKARAADLSWLKKKYRLGAYRRGCDDLLTRMICWLPFLLA